MELLKGSAKGREDEEDDGRSEEMRRVKRRVLAGINIVDSTESPGNRTKANKFLKSSDFYFS